MLLTAIAVFYVLLVLLVLGFYPACYCCYCYYYYYCTEFYALSVAAVGGYDILALSTADYVETLASVALAVAGVVFCCGFADYAVAGALLPLVPVAALLLEVLACEFAGCGVLATADTVRLLADC